MECYEKGILKKSNIDNLDLTWGNAEAIFELMRKITCREGFGDILAEGSARAARKIGRGSEYYAMNIKGQELYEVLRSAIGWALGVTTSTRGGGHTTGAPALETTGAIDPVKARELFRIDTFNQPLAYEGKAKLVDFFEDLHHITNSLGVCHFNTVWLDPTLPGFPELAELYSAATGWETTADELRWKAKRLLNLEKAFNLLRTGFSRKDDYPTPRDMKEPIPAGTGAGWKIEKKEWDALLDEYYEAHNWDKTTGFPTRKCLEALDLGHVADDLEKAGKLGKDIGKTVRKVGT